MYSQSLNHEYYSILLKKDEFETESEEDEPKDSTTSVSKTDKLFKEYTCTVVNCQRAYKSKSRLDKHYKSHFCETIYKCEYGGCYKVYRSKENLSLHVKNKHLGIKPYDCKFCFKRFSHRNGKIYHERKMHGDLIYLTCISM
jgi:hypothetical protein